MGITEIFRHFSKAEWEFLRKNALFFHHRWGKILKNWEDAFTLRGLFGKAEEE